MTAETAPGLSLWTIYDHPRDYPGHWVVRRFEVGPNGSGPTEDVSWHLSLEDARRDGVPPGLHRLVRNPEDDPVVVETWL